MGWKTLRMEWKTEGMELDVKDVMQASLEFGRTEHSEFLDMRKSIVSSIELPEVPESKEFHLELDEIDF